MKKINFLCTILILGFIILSCEDSGVESRFSTPPPTFTKKVLIEEFTGSWCGYCPSGAEILKDLMNTNNVIGVAIHSQDPMEISHGVFLESNYPSSGYPGGMVDRISYEGYVGHNRGWWSWFTEQQIQKVANCGLAINSEVNGDKIDVEIRSAFNTNISLDDHRINAYLLEDDVKGEDSGYDQRNYYNLDSLSSFFGQGDPIINYAHNNTLRASAFPNSFGGSLNDDDKIDMTYSTSFQMNISDYNKENLSVVAFIIKIGDTILDHEILNAQKCSVDGFQDWD